MPLVFEDGIWRLPDELLANIFELGHLSTDDGEYALRGVSLFSSIPGGLAKNANSVDMTFGHIP